MQIIPVRPGVVAQAMTVALDGVAYRLRLNWNSRGAYWYVSITTRGGQPLLTGRRLALNYGAIGDFADERLPPGELMPVDTTGRLDTITLADFGAAVVLMYISAAERQVVLDAIAAV